VFGGLRSVPSFKPRLMTGAFAFYREASMPPLAGLRLISVENRAEGVSKISFAIWLLPHSG
jgi:hypothetical protein